MLGAWSNPERSKAKTSDREGGIACLQRKTLRPGQRDVIHKSTGTYALTGSLPPTNSPEEPNIFCRSKLMVRR